MSASDSDGGSPRRDRGCKGARHGGAGDIHAHGISLFDAQPAGTEEGQSLHESHESLGQGTTEAGHLNPPPSHIPRPAIRISISPRTGPSAQPPTRPLPPSPREILARATRDDEGNISRERDASPLAHSPLPPSLTRDHSLGTIPTHSHGLAQNDEMWAVLGGGGGGGGGESGYMGEVVRVGQEDTHEDLSINYNLTGIRMLCVCVCVCAYAGVRAYKCAS